VLSDCSDTPSNDRFFDLTRFNSFNDFISSKSIVDTITSSSENLDLACKKIADTAYKNRINIETLIIPDDFSFSTSTTIELTINDTTRNVKYDVYTIKNNVPDDIVYTGNDTTIVIDNPVIAPTKTPVKISEKGSLPFQNSHQG
jgi:ribosomal protein S10